MASLRFRSRVRLLALAGLTGLAPAMAAAPATRPSGEVPATRPADAASARVHRAEGRASYSVLQADGAYGPYQPIKQGDLLGPGTRIRTSVRSRVVLIFGDNTVVMIDTATLASIDQFRKTAEGQEISLGLGHGMVRAGAAETTLRSDMIIQTPTATLSKRGTFSILLEYEPSTGHFRAALTDEGLITVLNRLTSQQRDVRPGQHVTDAMVRWIDTAKFTRWVPVQDVFGLTAPETNFNALYNTGPGVAQVGGGAMANLLSGRNDGGMSPAAIIQGRAALTTPLVIPQTDRPRFNRAEGNFGATR